MSSNEASTQRTNMDALVANYQQLFSVSPTGCATAPGRVNLIGEFTDYNQGYVLPCALEFATQVLFSKAQDELVTVYSTNYLGEMDEFDTSGDVCPGESQWGNYIRAVAFVLKRAGHKIGGLNLLISSNVPQGAGLSSSAALEVAIAGAFNDVFNLGLSSQQIALIGQQAENDFMDCQCGIMDQLISAQGERNHALMIDCQDLSTTSVSIPEDLSVVIVNSNHPRKLVESEYNQRRLDCEGAATKMGVSTLREASLDLLSTHQNELTENELKRARHVISENARVLDTVTALNNNDMPALISLLAASHHSLKYDFEVTVPATDGLVNIISQALGDKGAVRMTGGGFGGAVVCLCRQKDIATVQTAVEEHYHARFNLEADIFVCTAGSGLSIKEF